MEEAAAQRADGSWPRQGPFPSWVLFYHFSGFIRFSVGWGSSKGSGSGRASPVLPAGCSAPMPSDHGGEGAWRPEEGKHGQKELAAAVVLVKSLR